MASFSGGMCNSAPKVVPIESGALITMIRHFDSNEELLNVIGKKPQLLHDADTDDKTVLMWAVEKGREVIIDKCFENGVALECKDSDGWTAVMYAARRGNIEICEKILSFGASLDVESTEDKFSPLHLAAGNELILICVNLIKAGADYRRQDLTGKIPYDYLKIKKNQEIYKQAIADTYDGGKNQQQVHSARVDQGKEKSIKLKRVSLKE